MTPKCQQQAGKSFKSHSQDQITRGLASQETKWNSSRSRSIARMKKQKSKRKKGGGRLQDKGNLVTKPSQSTPLQSKLTRQKIKRRSLNVSRKSNWNKSRSMWRMSRRNRPVWRKRRTLDPQSRWTSKQRRIKKTKCLLQETPKRFWNSTAVVKRTASDG